MNFIIRWLVTAIAVGVAVWIVPGMDLLGGTDAWVGIAIFGLILSLINISIKPIMQVLSLPISVITLGIFYLVVNTLMRSETIGRVVCVNSERRSHANTTTAVQWARQKLGRRTSKAARAPAYT